MSQPAPSPIGGPPREAGGPRPTSDLDDLEQRIQRTRAQLGDTVAALSAKTHVAQRARTRTAELAHQAGQSGGVRRLRRAHPIGRIRALDPVGRVRAVAARANASRANGARADTTDAEDRYADARYADTAHGDGAPAWPVIVADHDGTVTTEYHTEATSRRRTLGQAVRAHRTPLLVAAGTATLTGAAMARTVVVVRRRREAARRRNRARRGLRALLLLVAADRARRRRAVRGPWDLRGHGLRGRRRARGGRR